MDGPRYIGAGDLPLFSTSLVPQQTNPDRPRKRQARPLTDERSDPRMDRLARGESYRLPPAHELETRFRHSGWELERLRVWTALVAANVRAGRLERFKECGGDCVVEWSQARKRHRLKANYCGDRFCLPCARARAVNVQRKVLALIGPESPLTMELTCRATDCTLNEALNHLLASFVRLRATKLWKNAVRGGAAFIEIKRGSGSGQWHPHLHVVAVGSYIAQRELSDAWERASGGSPVVWIQRAENADRAVPYATKYATKGWTTEVARDPDSLLECVLALRGRRLLLAFGSWHNAKLDEPERGPEDWVRVGRLPSIYAAANMGQSWAIGVFVSLGHAPEELRNKIMERRAAPS